MTKLVNKYHNVPYDVYIGRGSPFGNPYVIGIDGNRDEVISKYAKYFLNKIDTEPEFKKLVLQLKGKTLACFCSPKSCHGDIIITYLNSGMLYSSTDRDRCVCDNLNLKFFGYNH